MSRGPKKIAVQPIRRDFDFVGGEECSCDNNILIWTLMMARPLCCERNVYLTWAGCDVTLSGTQWVEAPTHGYVGLAGPSEITHLGQGHLLFHAHNPRLRPQDTT